MYMASLLDQLDQLVTLGASHADVSLAVLMEYVYRSADSVGVSATFQRMRYFLTTLSTAYAVSNGAGGANASAGGSVRYGGPGANPKGLAPKVCCGGPGAERPLCPRSGMILHFLRQAQGSAAASIGRRRVSTSIQQKPAAERWRRRPGRCHMSHARARA